MDVSSNFAVLLLLLYYTSIILYLKEWSTQNTTLALGIAIHQMLEPNIFFLTKKFLVITLGFFYFPLFSAYLIRDVTAGSLIVAPQGGFIALLHV